MISTVRGIVQQVSAGEMVVEVGGVGLRSWFRGRWSRRWHRSGMSSSCTPTFVVREAR
jgi:Holliday junction resolvasome RuvABC DNA-binding subunit